MERVPLLTVTVLALVTMVTAGIVPGGHETEVCEGGQLMTDCGSACTSTCDDPDPTCTKQCVARCQCPQDSPIWHEDQCIPRDECPVIRCPGGQVFVTCGSACTPTCDNTNPICTLQCVARCQCPKDRPLMHKGRCIPKQACPASTCPKGQVYTTCGSACTRTCENLNPICTKQCVERCECPADRPIWHKGECVAEEECHECPAGMVFDTCVLPEPCWPSCENPEGIQCRAPCRPGCKCPKERPIWHNGRCVPEKVCPRRECPGDQEWSSCACDATKTCSNLNPVCSKRCVERCQCPQDRPVLHRGRCISEKECPAISCRWGMEWNSCGSDCTKTCANPSPACTEQCVPRCECPKHAPIWYRGRCISQDHCPSMPRCPNNQVYQLCKFCTLTCEGTCVGGRDKLCFPGCGCPVETPFLHNSHCISRKDCPTCTGGKVWKECAQLCTPTCTEPNPLCRQPLMCQGGCECPEHRPLWNGSRCVTSHQCDSDHGSGSFRSSEETEEQ